MHLIDPLCELTVPVNALTPMPGETTPTDAEVEAKMVLSEVLSGMLSGLCAPRSYRGECAPRSYRGECAPYLGSGVHLGV